MTKLEFLAQLRKGLSGLPQDEIEERVIFYSEMIEDRMEEGLSEEDAVSAIGPVEEITKQTIQDTPLTKIATHTFKPKRQLSTWEILLIVLSFPIWFPIGVAVISVVFSLYVALWSVIISLWAVFASLICCIIAGILSGVALICGGNMLPGIGVIGAGIFCAGVSVFVFYGCNAAAKGIVMLTKKLALWIKNCFIRKEVA